METLSTKSGFASSLHVTGWWIWSGSRSASLARLVCAEPNPYGLCPGPPNPGCEKLKGEVVRLWAAAEAYGDAPARTVALISGAGGVSDGRGEFLADEVEAERDWIGLRGAEGGGWVEVVGETEAEVVVVGDDGLDDGKQPSAWVDSNEG